MSDKEQGDRRSWMEFHDSTFDSLHCDGADAKLIVNAYVHQWQVRHGLRRGTGWVQPVNILVQSVISSTARPSLPLDISDGRLRIGDVEHANRVELPLIAPELANLQLELVDDQIFEIAGRGVRIEACGEARFVEELPLDLWPGEAS